MFNLLNKYTSIMLISRIFHQNISPQISVFLDNQCAICASFCANVPMIVFTKNATTTANYSNYLDTETINFRWFLPFSTVFIVLNCFYRFELFLSFSTVFIVFKCFYRFQLFLPFSTVFIVINCFYRFQLFLSFSTVFIVFNCFNRFQLF